MSCMRVRSIRDPNLQQWATPNVVLQWAEQYYGNTRMSSPAHRRNITNLVNTLTEAIPRAYTNIANEAGVSVWWLSVDNTWGHSK